MTRDLATVTGRDLSDDNDEFRETDGFNPDEGYPYTYPFYYSGEALPRDLANTTNRDLSDVE